jgi:hypothetical protein
MDKTTDGSLPRGRDRHAGADVDALLARSVPAKAETSGSNGRNRYMFRLPDELG